MTRTVNADAHQPVDREHGAWLDEGWELGVGMQVRVRVRDGAHCARLGGVWLGWRLGLGLGLGLQLGSGLGLRWGLEMARVRDGEGEG